MKTLLDYIKEDIFDVDNAEKIIKAQLSDILDDSDELSIDGDTLMIENINGISTGINDKQLSKLIETCKLLNLKKINANEFYFDFKKDVDFEGIEIITGISNMMIVGNNKKDIKIKNFKYNDPAGLISINNQVIFENCTITTNCIENDGGVPMSKNSKIVTRIVEIICRELNEESKKLYSDCASCFYAIKHTGNVEWDAWNDIDKTGINVLDYIMVSRPNDKFYSDSNYVLCQKPVKKFNKGEKCELGNGKSIILINTKYYIS